MTDRVVVWSERNELHDPTGSEHDCAYSGILMVLVHGGKLDYPLGIYTAAEREALERSDNEPDETGANPADIDLAILTRYGLGAHAPTTDIRTLLTTPGLAVSVGGQLSNFPAGDALRRWAPNYTGGHRITYLTSSRTWLDPLAPWKFAGDTVSVDKVVAFAAKRAVGDLRYLRANELVGASTGGPNVPEEEPVISQVKGQDWKATNGILRAAPDTSSATLATLPDGTLIRSIAEVDVAGSGYSWRLTEYQGKPAYFVYKRLADGVIPDWQPIVDAGVDAALTAYIGRAVRTPKVLAPDLYEVQA